MSVFALGFLALGWDSASEQEFAATLRPDGPDLKRVVWSSDCAPLEPLACELTVGLRLVIDAASRSVVGVNAVQVFELQMAAFFLVFNKALCRFSYEEGCYSPW